MIEKFFWILGLALNCFDFVWCLIFIQGKMFFKTTRGIQVRLTKNQPVATIRRKIIKSSREDAVARARRIQIIVAVVVLTILKLLSSAFFSRPQVTTLFFIWLLGVFFFVATEATGVLHASQKTENKFWMGMSSLL